MSCLYCGKQRGLALFKKDGFCSAEHRRLWQEREASNLVQRLTEARDGREREPLRLPQRPSVEPAAAELSAGETVKQLGDGKATPPSEVGIVITRQPSVVPVTETPRLTPPEPKAADFAPPKSVEPQTPVVRKVTRTAAGPQATGNPTHRGSTSARTIQRCSGGNFGRRNQRRALLVLWQKARPGSF